MKNVAILLVAMCIASFANAQKIQDKDVPASAKASLQNKYPAAKELKWEKENGNYEAEFQTNETDYSILFDASGNILETEVEINVDALPANTKSYIQKNYAGKKIKEAAKITDAKGTVTYEAEIKGKDLIFDNNGNFLK